MDVGEAARKYYLQWRPRIEERTGRFWLCLCFLLLLDVLANPYAGIVHDARLYAVQALSHLHPQRYARDLFFLHGSQDSFSLFSAIHARIIALLGLRFGSWLLYAVSRLLLYAGILFFFRRLFVSNVLAFFASCLIAAGPMQYIFFELNEPFLTPRLAAMGLSLLSLGLAYGNSNILCLLCLLAAGLLHPLMALGPGIILFVFWLHNRRWSILAALACCLVLALVTMALLRPEAMGSLPLFAIFDQQWLAIIRQRSGYLFPSNWTRDQWLTIGSAIGLVLLGLRYLDRRQREFVLIISAVAILGIIITVAVVSGPQWILPFQLQPWRSFWVLQILSPAVACLISRSLWTSARFFHKLAGVLVATSFLLAGGASASTAPWLILAAVLIYFPFLEEAALPARVRQFLLVAAAGILLVLPLPMTVENLLAVSACKSWGCFVFVLVAGFGPYFRFAALGGAAAFLPFVTGKRVAMLIPVLLALLSLVTSRVDFEYPQISMAERGFFQRSQPTLSGIVAWRKEIPAGALILGDGSLPTAAIWFDLQASSYYSEMQGPGILFSRKLAMEYRKRKLGTEKAFNDGFAGEPAVWCRERGVDFIVSRKNFSLPIVGEAKGIHLYAVPTT